MESTDEKLDIPKSQRPLTFGSVDLAQFAYSPKSSSSLTTSSLRSSPRKSPVRVKRDDSLQALSDTVDSKRAVDEAGSPKKRSPKKLKRTYAAPETYAHLNGLHDWLKEQLDVMFCGINPGCMSADVGHHYANPTNHFYRCLFQSGFTARLLPPTEGYTLPELCSVGLTNLVERPTAEQSELSPLEMADCIPSFLAKVARYRPRIVCFVGMGIWRIVEKYLAKTASLDGVGRTAQISSPSKGKAKKSDVSNVGLQWYKLIYDGEHSKHTDQRWSVRETFFFVVPSTSGRVVSHQLPDKVKLFIDLKAAVEDYKHFRIDSGQMAVIRLPETSTNILS